jgi:lipopolysaccharide biosynthesis protein
MKHCIILHLYYIDLWEELYSHIKPLLGDNVDLIVTAQKNSILPQEVSKCAKQVIYCENRGMDIGPFLLAYKQLRGKYKTITKIHSKKSIHTSGIGEYWRKTLYTPILQSHKSLSNYLTEYEEPAMIGTGLYILSKEEDPGRSSEELQKHINTICTELGIVAEGSFIAGTMFIVNDIYMNSIFTDDIIDKIYNILPENYIRDNSAAHAMERIFGYLGTQTNLLVI